MEKYFRKRITLHYFSHQFWLVFVSISSRLVETRPVPSLWDAAEQSFLTTLRYSHAHSKAAVLGLFLWTWRSATSLLRPQLPGRGVGGMQLLFIFKINIFIRHLNAHIINSYTPAAVLWLILPSSPPSNWFTLQQVLLSKNAWDLCFPRKWSNNSLLFWKPSFCLRVFTEGSPICSSTEMKGSRFSFMLTSDCTVTSPPPLGSAAGSWIFSVQQPIAPSHSFGCWDLFTLHF